MGPMMDPTSQKQRVQHEMLANRQFFVREHTFIPDLQQIRNVKAKFIIRPDSLLVFENGNPIFSSQQLVFQSP
jgi:uncharacterized membrane protein YukC